MADLLTHTKRKHKHNTEIIKALDNECPICGSQDHIWKEIYIASKSRLIKLENKSVSWCEQVKDYVFITKANRILRPNE